MSLSTAAKETHGNSGNMHVTPAGNDQGLQISAHASLKADFSKFLRFASMHIFLRCALVWSLFCMHLVSLCRFFACGAQQLSWIPSSAAEACSLLRHLRSALRDWFLWLAVAC